MGPCPVRAEWLPQSSFPGAEMKNLQDIPVSAAIPEILSLVIRLDLQELQAHAAVKAATCV
jgi:hypothetical protein